MNTPQGLLEQLKHKFPVRQIPEHGNVIVIPALDYDPDWEAKLPDKNKCIDYEENGKAYTIVTLPNEPVKQTEVVQKRAEGGNKWQFVWKPEEDALLIALWNQTPRLSVPELTLKFRDKYPNRSPSAVPNRINNLQREHRITPRFTSKNREHQQEKKLEPKSASAEGYDALSKAYVELKTEVDRQLQFIHAKLVELNSKVPELERTIRLHKHADKTGEAMQPIEASEE